MSIKFYRETIDAEEEKIIPHESQTVNVLNLGPGNLFLNVNDTATSDSFLVPPNMARAFYFPHIVKHVHIISDANTTVQIDGMG